jgi:transposase
MTTTTSQKPVDQATLDRITFDTYVDCGRNATAAAKQLGCSPSTVTRRVKRHSLVATAADHGEDMSYDAAEQAAELADKAIESAKAVTSDVQDKLDSPSGVSTEQTIKLTGLTTFQSAAASFVPGYVEATNTTARFSGTATELVAAIDRALAERTDRGHRVALFSLQRKAAKLAERDAHVAAVVSLAEPRPLVCSVCGKNIATDGVSTGGAYYCPDHAPAQRKPRARTSGSSVTEGPPPRCPGGGQVGLDGPGSTRCTVCTQDAASVRRDGTLGSHKLLRPRQAVTS